MEPGARARRISRGCSSTRRRKGLPRVTLPDVWFVYRTNPAISFWDTGGARREDGALPVRRRVRLHARRDQPLRRHAAARRDRPREPAADPHRRLEVRRAVLGPRRASRCASRRSRPRGEARDFTDIATELAQRTGLLDKYNAAINRGAAGVPLKGAHGDFSLDAGRAHTREEIWDAVCRAASAELTDGAEIARPRLVEGARPRDQAVPAHRLVPVPDAGRAGPALRAALPGAAACASAPSSAAACTSTTCTGGTSSSPNTRRCRRGRISRRCGRRRVAQAGGEPQDYPFWLLTARSMQYAWGGNVGMQLIKEVADNVAGHRGVIINTQAAARARHRRRRPGRDRDAAAQRARPRGAAPGHPPRHAAADRPVRPLGDAVRQGLRRAEPEHARADVARPDRRHRLRRRHRARERMRTACREERAHDALGDGRRPAPLRRLPDLHRGVQARQRDAARRAVAARARHGVRRVPGRAARVRAGRLPALRRSAVHATCARPRRRGSAPTASSRSTTTCASAARYCAVACPYQARYKTQTARRSPTAQPTRERSEAPRRRAARAWRPSARSASTASTRASRRA